MKLEKKIENENLTHNGIFFREIKRFANSFRPSQPSYRFSDFIDNFFGLYMNNQIPVHYDDENISRENIVVGSYIYPEIEKLYIKE